MTRLQPAFLVLVLFSSCVGGSTRSSATTSETTQPSASKYRDMQLALRRAGFDAPQTGHLDERTIAALKEFQWEYGMEQTGALDEDSWAILKRYLE